MAADSTVKVTRHGGSLSETFDYATDLIRSELAAVPIYVDPAQLPEFHLELAQPEFREAA